MSMKKIALLFSCLLISIGLITAQTIRVTGSVISEDDGEPIMGASIVVKGNTSIGTITDIDGNFSLNVPESANLLVVSYVGMTPQEVAVSTQKLNITLSSSLELAEVVVTAMGISREKKALGYAVQDVKAEQLTMAASNDLSGALQGKVSGLDISPSSGMPGASSKITIRGSRSFTGDNTPLYVVDGMPIISTSNVNTGNSVTGADYANRSFDIDPNDIESINILKGQAASALYGMRASNGVIVITTKSGKNAKGGKPQVTFNSNYSFDAISITPKLQTEYAQGTGGAYSPTNSMSWGPRVVDLPNDPTYGGNVKNRYTDQYGMKNGQYYQPQRLAAGMDPWTTPQVYNNVDEFFQTGSTWSNNVGVIQAFDKGNYAFNLGNTTSEGIVPTTGMNRYNAKLSAEAKLSDQWTTGFNGYFTTSKILKSTGANDGLVATIYPAPPNYDLKGIPPHLENNPYSQNTYRGTGGFDGAYWSIKNNKFTERTHRFIGSVYTQFSTRMGTDNQKLDVRLQLGDDSYTTNYSEVWGYGHANGFGEIDERGYTNNEFNSTFTLNYDWNINSDLNLNFLAGNEFVHSSLKYIYGGGMNFNFPGWNHMNNTSVPFSSESYSRRRAIGTFGNLSLSYKNMLYFTATGRNDRVSYMPRDNRTYFYPSASLGFIFTEMESFKNDIVTFGKLRISYAEVGQAAEAYYSSYYSTPSYGGGFSSGTPISYPVGGITAYTPYGRIYDPKLKPQNTKSYEIGTDLTFLKGLFTINYTYSRQNVKDQIFDIPLAGSTGYDEIRTNGGSMYTNAHEVTLDVNPIDNKNFKWNFGINFTKIDNHVEELANGVESIMLGGFVEPQVRVSIGYKYPVIYGVDYMRNDEGKIVVNSRGLPMGGEAKELGTVAPDFRAGFNTSFEIFKFRLGAVFEWKQGGYIYSATPGLLDFYGITQKSADYRNGDWFVVENSVKQTGTDANGKPIYAPNDIKIAPNIDAANKYVADNGGARPATSQDYLSAENDVTASMVVENSFIKLREISLSYPVWNKKNLNVSLNAFARNITLWSTLEGMDPESSQGNNNMSGGFERFSLPGTSSYGLGLTVKF